MKVTLSWLKKYVEVNETADSVAHRLTMLGIEVEEVRPLPGEFEGIVVGEILSREKVPGSDKLSVCRVRDGQAERQVICGAQNFKPGDKAPLILPGASLPMRPGEKTPFTIKVRKVMGVESHGMLCSPEELGLPDAVDGILILPPEARVGQPFAEFMGRPAADVLFDLEITPNRPDLNSVIGIARELAAVMGKPLQLPQIRMDHASMDHQHPARDSVAVRVEDPELCPRYVARVIRGVRVGPSPSWLKAQLEKVGLRSINNAVDVTNYVMLETGQPLHAFDYRLLKAAENSIPTIVVRRAQSNEPFVTLDGQKHSLTTEMLLIADEFRPIALAGVMGGANTEIQNQTTEILLESACFDATNIRRTSKTLGLRTDASYRFERGTDIEMCEWASLRAASLILELAAGSLALGSVEFQAARAHPGEIQLRHHRVQEVLGITLRPQEIEYYLAQLGLHHLNRRPRPIEEDAPAEPARFRIPSFRSDLKSEIDLIEEVARLHGVEKIPATPPRCATGSHPFDAEHDVFLRVRRILTALGLSEAQGQTLIGHDAAERSMEADTTAAPVALANPLSSDMTTLRTSLLPGLLDSLGHNMNHRNADVALFEIGRTFVGQGDATRERWRVALAITGARAPAFWSGEERDARMDLADLKGVVEELLEQLGISGVSYRARATPGSWYSSAADLVLGGRIVLGEMGQLSPLLGRKHHLRDAVYMAEFDWEQLVARRGNPRTFTPLPAFPAVRRDVALIVGDRTTHEMVAAAVKKQRPANLEEVHLFDVFRGGNVPAEKKSMAYAFTYRSKEKTLTDAEVAEIHGKLVSGLKTALDAVVRE